MGRERMRLFPVIGVLGLIAALITLPIALRTAAPARAAPSGIVRLTILTPHGEPTRAEFARAFAEWAMRERGIQVDVNWLTPGGTSEITRYLDELYRTAARRAFPDWTSAQLRAFADPAMDQADDPSSADLREARRRFLASDLSIGIDGYFGGGEFPFRQQANKGYLVDAGLIQTEPTWFTPQVMPQVLSGETIYDPTGRYYGACLATFGIAASVDRLADLQLPQPRQWADLGEPAYFQHLTLADPTKSGAVVTTMERIIQQTMDTEHWHLNIAHDQKTEEIEHQMALVSGWAKGLNLIKRLVANSRALTDSASKPTRDTVRGDCVASMAIDFQAKAEAAWSAEESGGSPRLVFAVPAGGTSVSPDPIALLRGAPQRALMIDFIRFVLSPDGQRLWSYRRGVPGGPLRYELHRMPVRADVYTPMDRERMSHPEDDPYAIAKTFTYHADWTGRIYGLIGPVVKATMLDARSELTAAWRAIIAAGGPARVPEAWQAFTWTPFTYDEAPAMTTRLKDGPAVALPLIRSWNEQAIARYREAERLARAGR